MGILVMLVNLIGSVFKFLFKMAGYFFKGIGWYSKELKLYVKGQKVDTKSTDIYKRYRNDHNL